MFYVLLVAVSMAGAWGALNMMALVVRRFVKQTPEIIIGYVYGELVVEFVLTHNRANAIEQLCLALWKKGLTMSEIVPVIDRFMVDAGFMRHPAQPSNERG